MRTHDGSDGALASQVESFLALRGEMLLPSDRREARRLLALLCEWLRARAVSASLPTPVGSDRDDRSIVRDGWAIFSPVRREPTCGVTHESVYVCECFACSGSGRPEVAEAAIYTVPDDDTDTFGRPDPDVVGAAFERSMASAWEAR